jgi:D-alanyl-D-alanine carboxypeptidase/D-alanyl-D-alanine-endopeptidase (penicillin-binding protein 4)
MTGRCRRLAAAARACFRGAMRTPAVPSRSLRRLPALLGLAGAIAFARPALPDPPPASGAAAATSAAQPSAPPPSTPAASAASSSIDAAKIKDAVRDLASDAKTWGGTAGAMVVDLSTGAALAAADEHTALNPASNAKLATAAAALRLLGPDHRFLTGLYGKLGGSRVASLVLRGFGDPTLESDDLAALARELRARGVRKVDAILVDQSYFDDAFTPPAFAQQPNEWAPFRAPVSAVSINENTVLLTARPTEDGKPALVTLDPPGVAKLTGTVRTTKKSDPDKFGASLSANGGALTVKVSGHVPEGGDLLRVARRLEDPRLAPGLALRAALADAGIEAADDVRLGGEKEKDLLAAHRSDTLAHLLAKLGKDSDNFVAETVFKTLAAEQKSRPATWAAAAEVVIAELRAMGAFESGCSVQNGSGLFDANRTTAASTAALLRNAYQDAKIAPEFVAQLAVGGVDGTLRGRFKAWSKTRAVRAKTGTLNASFALSGYVLGPPGKPAVAFSLLVNGASGKAGPARADMDKVVDAIARALWGAAPT